MIPDQQSGKKLDRRKILTYLAGSALVYPLFQFIGYRVPKKPVYVPINQTLPTTGYVVTPDFVLFDREDICWALSRKCTHLGCKLNYHEENDILECPCHQSQFVAKSGEVVKGPAKKPLPFFPVEKRSSEPYYIVTT